MRNFALIVAICCFVSAKAQTAWDSTYRPGSYVLKKPQFESYPKSPNDVIMIGNSITDYNEWHEMLPSPFVKNRGISGDITFGVLERLDDVVKGQPSKIFILIGINDISRGIPTSVIIRNHERMVEKIKRESPRTRIYLQTILPVNREFPNREKFDKEKQILEVNEALKKLAKRENATLIDLYSHFADAKGYLPKEYTYDGLHLNHKGYERWVKLIAIHARPPHFEHPVFNKEGHRGIRGLSPENTIPSMYMAIDKGANTLEVDVLISKDKKVVVSHDVYFHPDFTTTPQGKTLTADEAQQHHLYRMDYDSIRKYDVGLKPHPAFPEQEKIAAYKPLLSELIDSVDAYARRKGKQIYYNIEIKASRSWDGLQQPTVQELVELVMEVVRERKIESRCYLQSFDFRVMQIINRQYPDIETAVLMGGNDKRSLKQQIADLGYTPGIYSPHFSAVTPQLVNECHDMGMKIIPWTVNKKEDMDKLKAMGVDGIITDFVNLLD